MMAIAVAILVPLAVHPVSAQTQLPTAPMVVVPDRYIVELKSSYQASAEVFAAEVDRRPGVDVDLTYASAFPGFAGTFTKAAIETLLQDPNVYSVTPDMEVHAQGQSLEPNINRVDADLGYAKSGNESGTVDVDVAVIDSGIGPNSDLNIISGTNCMGDGYMRDYYGHGTHVSGIIGAADNSYGVVGMAPGARLWMVRSLDRYGGGTWSQIICGMDWVAAHGSTIEVANMSLGAGMPENGTGCNSSVAHQAICSMVNAGVTVVAAACNANMDASTCTPGKYPEVISVSAYAEFDGKMGGLGGCKTTPDGFYGCDDRRASFSNYGPTVDIAAPGVGVRSTLFDNKFGYWSGTSMATPHVTGAAALLIAKYGRMAPAEVRSRLLLSAQNGPVPGDPDGYPEPILNVASLGKGEISHFQSLQNGDSVTVEGKEFVPATTATFWLDGKSIGTGKVDSKGVAILHYSVSGLAYGTHTFKVTNNRKSVSDDFLVRPLVTLNRSTVTVGALVSVRLTGFSASSSTVIAIDTGNGRRSLVRVTTDSRGAASATITVPPAASGYRHVSAIDGAGVTTYRNLRITPSMTTSGSVVAGDWTAISLRGFGSGESVDLRWGSASGIILRTKSVTGSGSGDVNVPIPADATTGSHSLWAIGSAGSAVRVTINTVGEASDSTASPTATAKASLTVTATASPTTASVTTTATVEATSTETATLEPTATVPSTETSTATSPAPTETVTLLPTATDSPTVETDGP